MFVFSGQEAYTTLQRTQSHRMLVDFLVKLDASDLFLHTADRTYYKRDNRKY